MHTDTIVIDTYLSGVTDAPRLTTLYLFTSVLSTKLFAYCG